MFKNVLGYAKVGNIPFDHSANNVSFECTLNIGSLTFKKLMSKLNTLGEKNIS